jgi:cysteinyl-tRNA synthetase
MSMRHLGPSFDIHTGGIDLIFPHHEDEIAQSEAATGQRFVTTWLHCDHLRVGGEKMARRSGQFLRPSDVLEQGWSARALRYALLAAHYRAPLEFGDETMPAAAAAVERLSTALAALDLAAGREESPPDDPDIGGLLEATVTEFETALDDDLNIAPALAAVFDLVRELNRRLAAGSLSAVDAQRAAETLRDLDRVLAVMEPDAGDGQLPDEVAALLEERVAARAARDWARSDALRDQLAAMGILVEDTRDGQRWRRIEEPGDGAV